MHLSSHILLGRMLLQNSALQDRPLHRIAFLFGSIRPDIMGSFIIKKHTPGMRYSHVLAQIERSVNDALSGRDRNCLSTIRLGVICHFLADFFCYPHNEAFKYGSVIHYRYETALYDYIKNPALPAALDEAPSSDLVAVISRLSELRGQYVDGIQSDLSRDAFYIVTVCRYIFSCIEFAALQSQHFSALATAKC